MDVNVKCNRLFSVDRLSVAMLVSRAEKSLSFSSYSEGVALS